MPTAFEIAQVRQVPLSSGLLAAVRMDAPAFSRFDARTVTSKRFKTLAIVSLPTSNFVRLGQGLSASQAQLALREFDCSMIGGLVKADTITMDEWNEDGADASGYDYFDLQTYLRIKADVLKIEKQIFYGTTSDALGFPGLKQITPFLNTLALTETADDTDYTKTVVNAGGSNANACSSIYSVVFGELACQLIIGSAPTGSELFQMGEIRFQHLAPDPTNAPDALLEFQLQQIHGFVGVSVSAMNPQTEGAVIPVQYTARRLANVSANAPNSDSKMNALVQSHPDDQRPSMLFMSKRSGQQLANGKASTQVTFFQGMTGNATNASVSLTPPPPDNWEGIPICYTRAIRNDDAVEA